MKKLMLLVVLLAGTIEVCAKERLYYVSAGGSQESVSVDFGRTSVLKSKGRNNLLGLTITHFYGSDNDLLLGQEQKTFAITGKYGIEAIENSGLFLTVLGGVSFVDTKTLELEEDPSASNYGTYHENVEGSSNFMYGVGATYLIPDWHLILSMDYDNQRELTTTLGYSWKF